MTINSAHETAAQADEARDRGTEHEAEEHEAARHEAADIGAGRPEQEGPLDHARHTIQNAVDRLSGRIHSSGRKG
jgi:hypothetical protein